MRPRTRCPLGPHGRRRGVTLIEMLTVVPLVILMMTILVQIFQSATSATSLSRTTSEMDMTLRQIESIIRTDLAGVTAKMTPPNDPKDQRGYFEYGENAPADLQGEDTDDYLAFTTKAPDGSFFTGRQAIQQPTAPGHTAKFTLAPITSPVAEVIYFLRNGNLYRRVFLVAPERKTSIIRGALPDGGFNTNLFGSTIYASWLGLNDLSCHPATSPGGGVTVPIPNTLGDLTNRENRAFRPRFSNDLRSSDDFTLVPDGLVDDFNNDGLPDYYTTFYASGGNVPYHDVQGNLGTAPNGQIFNLNTFPSNLRRYSGSNYNIYAFPYIFPGMYTFPVGYQLPAPIRFGTNLGWSHCLAPAQVNAMAGNLSSKMYVNNHSPLDVGDNLAAPAANQTWFGFPTWRETMTGFIAANPRTGASAGMVGWLDPAAQVGSGLLGASQPLGLQPFGPAAIASIQSMNGSGNLLPQIPLTAEPLPYTDTGAGSNHFVAVPDKPHRVWEDDLVLTKVRSFDVKAYDTNAPFYNTTANGYFSAGYQDLGYGSAQYEQTGSTANASSGYNYIYGPNGQVDVTKTLQVAVPWQGVGAEPVGFGHEGRIPPLSTDYRFHPRKGNNIGDDGAGVIRLTRVWDSWSTDYTNAPDTDIYLTNYSAGLPAVYPSFPPPYPSPLRGIQVQIRMTDARGERTKAITIRHDFTDKLN